MKFSEMCRGCKRRLVFRKPAGGAARFSGCMDTVAYAYLMRKADRDLVREMFAFNASDGRFVNPVTEFGWSNESPPPFRMTEEEMTERFLDDKHHECCPYYAEMLMEEWNGIGGA